MKEMIYQNSWCFETLDNGEYLGYKYFIFSYGMYPCAYVKLPDNHPFYGNFYDIIPIRCHGGLTFSGEYSELGYGFFIGWDYAHEGDYYTFVNPLIPGDGLKRWTTPEILEEVKDVIRQLKKA